MPTKKIILIAVAVIVLLSCCSGVALVAAYAGAFKFAGIYWQPNGNLTNGSIKNGTATVSCVVGGCSSQLCTDSNAGDMVSDCMYREEYACLQYERCEQQSNGECGWTITPDAQGCLNRFK